MPDDPPGDRPPADGRSEVQFVESGPAADDFEDLPSREPAPRRRVLLLVWAVVVGLGLVAAVVARVVTSTSGSADGRVTVTASPSVSSAPSGSGTSGSGPSGSGSSSRQVPFAVPPELRFLPGITTAEIAAARAECPRLAQVCTPTGEVPAAVRDALRARFPRARKFVALSDIAYAAASGPRLAYRRVSARSGDLRITVEVRQATAPVHDGGVSLITGGMAMVRVQLGTGPYVVEAQLTSPHAQAPDASGLSRLVRDPRLLATG